MLENKKILLFGLAAIVLIFVAWYCMPPSKKKKKKLSIDNFTAHPKNLGEMMKRSQYKKPILGGVDNFLSKQECDEIIEIGKQIVKPSTVGFGDAAVVDTVSRASEHNWLKHDATPGIKRLTEYVSNLLKIPVSYFEPYQLLHYKSGGFYKYHLDSCNPSAADYSECLKNMEQNGGRKWTCIVYLNDDYIGGETHFNKIDEKIKRPPGSLVLFKNFKETSRETNPLAEHAGTPVISGYKWLLNLWIRDKKYMDDFSESTWPCLTMLQEIKANHHMQGGQQSMQERDPDDNELPSKRPPDIPDITNHADLPTPHEQSVQTVG